MTLKLEVGKSYRNRLGEKVTINRKCDKSVYPFIGLHGLSYLEDGRLCHGSEDSEDLISEWEEPIKYKAGDLVTIKLSSKQAEQIVYGSTAVSHNMIVSHEPAPEPVSVWMNYYYKTSQIQPDCFTSFGDAKANSKNDALIIRLDVDPSTKQATATVVE